MPPGRQDERLGAAVASRLLEDLVVYCCTGCRLVLLRESREVFRISPHSRCGGRWVVEKEPLRRALLLGFLSRQMFGAGWGRHQAI